MLLEQNPWNVTGVVPLALAKETERPSSLLLTDRLANPTPRRFQLIIGPRRVGKTTAMYQSVRHLLAQGVPKETLWWLRLDHPLLVENSLGSLVRALLDTVNASAARPLYLFLDELTYAKAWDLWLKTFHDEQWPIRIAGTSSSTAALKDRSLESGVGRWEEHYLAPYLFAEYLALIGEPWEIPTGETLAGTIAACIAAGTPARDLTAHTRRLLFTGGFPELLGLLTETGYASGPRSEESLLFESQRVLRSDAVERAVYKDIPSAFGVDNPALLERLLYTLAGQFTGILSPATVCQTVEGLSQPTFTRYVSYLERSFLIFTLPNYSASEANVQKRGRKVYFVDGAVRNAALQRGLGPLTDAPEMGLLVENMAAAHLHALATQGQVRLFHWRDKNDEVDFIYDHPAEPLAFEIGSSPGHHRRGLLALMARYPRFVGKCYLVSPHAPLRAPHASADRIGTVPLELFLVAVGKQAAREMAKRFGSPRASGP